MTYIPAGALQRLSNSQRRDFYGILATGVTPTILLLALAAFEEVIWPLVVVLIILLPLYFNFMRLWWQYRPPKVVTFHLYVLTLAVVIVASVAAFLAISNYPNEYFTSDVYAAIIVAIGLLVLRISLGIKNQIDQKRAGVYKKYRQKRSLG